MKNFKLGKWGVGLSAIVGSMLLPLLGYAAESKDAGILAENIFSGVMSISEIIKKVCIIVGAFLILSSFFQYKKYRHNPSEMPISRPITTLIVGLILIALTFVPIQLMNSKY
jgi:hypothetical protein